MTQQHQTDRDHSTMSAPERQLTRQYKPRAASSPTRADSHCSARAHSSPSTGMSNRQARDRQGGCSTSGRWSGSRRVAHEAAAVLQHRHLDISRVSSRRCSSAADEDTACCVVSHESQHPDPLGGSSGGHASGRKQHESCYGARAARTAWSVVCVKLPFESPARAR